MELYDIFWNPRIWLPYNLTWSDLEATDSSTSYSSFLNIYCTILGASIFIVLRKCLDRYCYSPLGKFLGIPIQKLKKIEENELLEHLYQSKAIDDFHKVLRVSKALKWSVRQVEIWLKYRRTRDVPTKMHKFTEEAFKFTYYSYSFLYGLVVLWAKPWLWNINLCWENFPHQSITLDIYMYYMTSLSFYTSLLVTQFCDVRRSDFYQMFIHHCATIFLLSLSWVCHFHRIGCLVLLVHDCADIFLEGAKMAKYAKYQKTCDSLFVVFVVCWLVTRTGLFPFWIIHNTAFVTPSIADVYPAYFIFNACLILLFVLHLLWTRIILQLAYNSFKSGEMKKDIRSSSSEEEIQSTKKKHYSEQHQNKRQDRNQSAEIKQKSRRKRKT